MRLARRTFLGTAIAALLAATVVGALLADRAADEAREGIRTRLETGVRMLAVVLAAPDAPVDSASLDPWIDAVARSADARLTVVDPDGRVVADSEFDGAALAGLDDHSGRTEIRGAITDGEAAASRYSRSLDSELLYRARRIEAGPWAGGVVRMAVPATRVEAARSAAAGRFGLALVLAVGIALAVGWLVARRTHRPLAELTATALRVAEGDLDARARVTTGDELEDLARALTRATDRLADRIEVATTERDRLEAVVDGMVEGVVVIDSRERIILANAALHTMFGLGRTVEGRTVLEALRHPEVADALLEAATGGHSVTREISVTWPTERALDLHAVGLGDEGAVGVFHDITARRRVDEVRRDFVANVSHELQTPLTTLAAYAEALSDPTTGEEESREVARVIARQVGRLSDLVRDLLELSRLEADGFAPDREIVHADRLAEDLAREWTPRAEDRGIALTTGVEPDLRFRSDPRLLRQALGNLIDNALKYCPRGAEVILKAGRVDDVIELEVVDTGHGIPLEDQERLFERFYRVEKGRARETGGTGLGLAIVKHAAESLGGKVEVESTPGKGTAFRIRFPYDEVRVARV